MRGWPWRERWHWIVGVGLAAAAIGHLALAIIPTQQAIGQLRRERAAIQAELARRPELNLEVAKKQAELQSTREYVAERFGPEQPGRMSAQLGGVARTVKAVGLTTQQLSPLSPVIRRSITQSPTALHCRGTFTQIAELIVTLEKYQGLSWIEVLSLRKSESNEAILECEIRLVIFAHNSRSSD